MFKVLLLTVALVGCSSSSSGGGGGGGPAGAGGVGQAPLVQDNTKGGCRIRLVTPKPGETIDLSNGKTYEFAWTTDGTTCETPYTIYAAGNPADVAAGTNIISGSISTNGATITQKGGLINVSAADLTGLTSTDGSYQWVVASFHGSHPASQVFVIIK